MTNFFTKYYIYENWEDLTIECLVRDSLSGLILAVLHMMDFKIETDSLFAEIKRILKPGGGKLAVIECKKEKSSFGPPLQVRILPEELENSFGKFGFSKTEYIDLEFNYMVIFILSQ